MNIYWFEQRLEDVPSDQAWLSTGEVERLRSMRFPKRRGDWLLGRWTAKNAVAVFLETSNDLSDLREIEVHASASGAPVVYFRNEPTGIEISLSHRGFVGACAIAPAGALLGCDLELIEPHCDAFAKDYLSSEEQVLVCRYDAANRLLVVALLWSAKESALKALKEGLRLDTRLVRVNFPEEPPKLVFQPNHTVQDSFRFEELTPDTSWSPLEVRYQCHQALGGWWARTGSLIRTVLAAPPAGKPILLIKDGASQHCSSAVRVNSVVALQSCADPNSSCGSW